jgi:uncharacterized protein DUF4337
MAWDELGRMAEEDNNRDRERWIGVWIGALAVILAICSMGGNNAGKDATLKNIEAANTWAFFQAKNMRRQAVRLQVDELQLQIDTNPQLAPATREAIQKKLTEYHDLDKQLTSNKQNNEGLDELWTKAKALEADRDTAMQKDPYFDYAEAALQIAIVLASISIITGGLWMLTGSIALGVLGIFLTFNGYTLLVALPGIG